MENVETVIVLFVKYYLRVRKPYHNTNVLVLIFLISFNPSAGIG